MDVHREYTGIKVLGSHLSQSFRQIVLKLGFMLESPTKVFKKYRRLGSCPQSVI